jgi:hypothetical protein
VALGSPFMIGVYEDKKLIFEKSIEGQTSELLPIELQKLLKYYNFEKILYANGPGSFMSIKISYVMLKTLSVSHNIPIYATDGFAFNQNSPIKAFGDIVFVKKNGKISTQKKDEESFVKFLLPQDISLISFHNDIEPLYILPAV